MITIRRIKVGESDLYKQIRLTSLQDAPYAFSSTYKSALQRSAKSWREQVDNTAQGSDRATFLVFSDDIPIGIAALYRVEGHIDIGEVLQVWVSPEHRGTSVAWDLMDVVFVWAGENNFHKIKAGVTKTNSRAFRFYIKYGFTVAEESSRNDVEGVSLVKEVKQSKLP